MSGFLSGLFGVGGGFIIVPLLIWLLGFEIRRAAATSLAAIAITALAGIVGYAIHDGVVWLAGLALVVGSMLGSYAGARLLKVISPILLMWVYVTLLTVLAVRLLFADSASGGSVVALGWQQILGLFFLGLAAGVLAGLLGVGGGILVVPLLVFFFGLTPFQAKGTSLVMMLPASVVGTIVNYKNRMVDLRAGISIGIVAALVSYAGVAVSAVMPALLGNLLFAVLMLATAAQFALRAVRSRQSRLKR